MPRIVINVGDAILDLASLVPDAPASLLQLIQDWDRFHGSVARSVENASVPSLDASTLKWLAPLMPHKLICAGANYQDHNKEMLGAIQHPFPYTFLKPPTTTVVGSGTPVALPAHATKIDYEAELAVVIDAKSDIFGYTIMNDLSARDWIPAATFLGLDWVMLKGFDGSAPLGPWITPAEFVPDPQALPVRLTLNGDIRQDGNTSNMVFSVRQLVDHLSAFMTLEAGDVIATGTPSGVGMGRTPPEYLKAGDEIKVEIEGLGALETTIVAAHTANKEKLHGR